MKLNMIWAAALMAAMLPGCTNPADAEAVRERPAEGHPYELAGTQVWTVPDPASGRNYQVFVSLPPGYEANAARRYPVMYVADADYGFPLIRSIAKRVNLEGPAVEDFILVGLSYAVGEDGANSRRRDYTPTPNGPRSAGNALHGAGAAYQNYIKAQVLPFVEQHFRADPARRVFMGHSYGALLGTQILFTEPTLFHDYILGSPSLWYDRRHMLDVEAAYARDHRDLPANLFFYVGALEAVRPGDRRYNQEADLVADLATFEQRLRARGYPGLRIASVVLPDENHLTVFPPGFTRGLVHALPARR